MTKKEVMSVLLAITLMLPQTAIGATTTETTTAVVETEEGNSAVDSGETDQETVSLKIGGIEIQIPAEWQYAPESNSSNITYTINETDYSDASFGVTYNELEHMEFDEFMKQYLGILSNNFDITDKTEIQINNVTAYEYNIDSGEKLDSPSGKVAFYPSGNNTFITFLLYQSEYSEDYSGEFDQIISSIRVLQADEIMNEYEEGTYLVGQNIPAGEYILIKDYNRGYFSVSSDANGDDIIFNDNFNNNSIITVNDGEYLRLSRCTAYPYDIWHQSNTLDTTQEGMFKVGVDIPAGTYEIDATSESGYWCIYSDSRQSDIVSNENFKGMTYCQLSDGQYLELSRCTLHIE